ncbi:GH39 family glycosyl hydrolase [Aeoliella mucimassa]|uniref:Glycosyl hydrolases family 39 N-terminal catalytic domain-containing protein n=1 Tax=Aeoliella mucimassa TaxID=2527972 RepID=A0A518AKT6_9BACT|nr:beta-galactosidase [Aeoliella mucimassa]QDU55306.1 hypothetical protein Pan181_14950 [Aeoliella mucimassa]
MLGRHPLSVTRRLVLLCFIGWTSHAIAQDELTGQPLSPFGIGSCHVNNRSVRDYERWVPQMQELGFASYRTPHCNWGSLEPEPGRWEFAELDAQMDYLDAHGFRYGALLIGNPNWNTADPPGHLPVNNLEAWSNYVTQVAKHVKGRTTRLEIWNEPPNFTGKDQTPEDYAKIVVAAYDAAKAVDPSFQIGLAAKSAHVNYLEQTIRAGAKNHFDYIVLHPYEVMDGIADNLGTEVLFVNIVPTVRKMLANCNPEKEEVPVMYTELGVDASKGLEVQADAAVKAYALSMAGGVECLMWFEGRDGDSGPMGLIDRDGNKRPVYNALSTLVHQLGAHPDYLGWVRIREQGLGFVFEGANGPAMIAWGQPGEPTELRMPNEMTVVQLASGESQQLRELSLGVTPVLFTELPDIIVNRAKANAKKPLDWGGDYTDAKEVSIEYGEQIVERGLHTRAGEDIAKAVVAYGGSARAGSVPGGNAFIVDPGFLCYDTVPIEIELEVRRQEQNENAGFKLVYESPEGFKTAGGWYTIPDNKQWHTVTFRVDDPQFVNYWGYNFLLQSDGNVYNKYYIRKATVRKLE